MNRRQLAVLTLLAATLLIPAAGSAHHSKDARLQQLKFDMDAACAVAFSFAADDRKGRKHRRACRRLTKHHSQRKAVLDRESAERRREQRLAEQRRQVASRPRIRSVNRTPVGGVVQMMCSASRGDAAIVAIALASTWDQYSEREQKAIWVRAWTTCPVMARAITDAATALSF